MNSTDTSSLWTLTRNLKRRKSPNGINLVFVPGQNVVLELNEVAGDVIEILADGPSSYEALCARLGEIYDIGDTETFRNDVDQLLERFITHHLIVPQPVGVE